MKKTIKAALFAGTIAFTMGGLTNISLAGSHIPKYLDNSMHNMMKVTTYPYYLDNSMHNMMKVTTYPYYLDHSMHSYK